MKWYRHPSVTGDGAVVHQGKTYEMRGGVFGPVEDGVALRQDFEPVAAPEWGQERSRPRRKAVETAEAVETQVVVEEQEVETEEPRQRRRRAAED